MSKISIKEASQTLASTVTKFKTAQEGGTMSPEEVVEAIQPIIEMASTIAEVGSEIQEGVPAQQGMDSVSGLAEKPTMGMGEETNSPPMANGEDEEKEELRSKLSQLQAQMDDLKEEKEKEKLAQKYAQLFPVPMRESKIKEFMTRTGAVGLLEAQVQEAESLMGSQNAVKQAQIEEGTYDLHNFTEDNNSSIDVRTKY